MRAVRLDSTDLTTKWRPLRSRHPALIPRPRCGTKSDGAVGTHGTNGDDIHDGTLPVVGHGLRGAPVGAETLQVGINEGGIAAHCVRRLSLELAVRIAEEGPDDVVPLRP